MDLNEILEHCRGRPTWGICGQGRNFARATLAVIARMRLTAQGLQRAAQICSGYRISRKNTQQVLRELVLGTRPFGKVALAMKLATASRHIGALHDADDLLLRYV